MLNNKQLKSSHQQLNLGLASGLSFHLPDHQTIEQPLVLTILYLYCTGGTECCICIATTHHVHGYGTDCAALIPHFQALYYLVSYKLLYFTVCCLVTIL